MTDEHVDGLKYLLHSWGFVEAVINVRTYYGRTDVCGEIPRSIPIPTQQER